MRSRVDLEVASAAGFSPNDTGRVIAALATVGSTARWPGVASISSAAGRCDGW